MKVDVLILEVTEPTYSAAKNSDFVLILGFLSSNVAQLAYTNERILGHSIPIKPIHLLQISGQKMLAALIVLQQSLCQLNWYFVRLLSDV